MFGKVSFFFNFWRNIRTTKASQLFSKYEKNGSQDKPAWNASNKRVPTPSIKELEIHKLLGEGNFSSIYSCQHKETKRVFALKVIEKKKVESLAKREHPNAYNEVNMERRVLGERLRSSDHPTHPFVIHMYHAFQDYQNLYLLMDLHEGKYGRLSDIKGNLLVAMHHLLDFIWLNWLKYWNIFIVRASFIGILRLKKYFDCQDWSYCLNRLWYRQRSESN